jgi:hypothetical protein
VGRDRDARLPAGDDRWSESLKAAPFWESQRDAGVNCRARRRAGQGREDVDNARVLCGLGVPTRRRLHQHIYTTGELWFARDVDDSLAKSSGGNKLRVEDAMA